MNKRTNKRKLVQSRYDTRSLVDLKVFAQASRVQMVLDDVETLNYDSLEAVAHLRASERYREIMQVPAFLCSCVPAKL